MVNQGSPERQLIHEVKALRQRVAELEQLRSNRPSGRISISQTRQELERLVAERTAALKESNDQLIAEIVERRRVETALRRSEERFRNLVETTNDLVWEQDEQGIYTYVSPNVRTILGYTPDEVLGKTADCFLATPADIAENGLGDRLSVQRSSSLVEKVVLHKEGYCIVMESNAVPIMDRSGQCRGYRGIDRDISDRKQAEEALRESQLYYQSLTDVLPQCLYRSDRLGRITFANPAFLTMLGLPLQDCLGKTVHDLYPKELAERYAIDDHRVIYDGSPIDKTELFWSHSLNKCIYVHIVKTPVRDEKGIIIGLQGMFWDVSDRIQSEAHLREQEHFLRSIYNGVADSIFVVDVLDNGELRYAGFNPAHEHLTGLTAAQVRGKTPEQVFSPDIAATLRQHYQDCITTGEKITYEERLPLQLSDAWWLTSLTPLRNPTGRIYRLIGTCTDISDRKRTELLVQQQAEREKLLGTIALRIRQSLELDAILHTSVDEIRTLLETDRVLIYRFNPDWSGVVAVESVAGDCPSVLGSTLSDPCFAENYVQPYRNGRISAINNIHQSDLTPCYIEFLKHYQVYANLVVPIVHGETLWGLLVAHHCRAPRHWEPLEISLLQQLANQVAIAVQQSEFYQQAQTELAERKQVEAELRSAKDQLQAILEAVPGIVSWISSDLRYLGVNRHLARTFNLPPEVFVGQEIGFLQTSSEFDRFIRDFFASPAADACCEVSARVGGSDRTFLIVAQKYDQDQAAFTIGIDITERRQAITALEQAEEKYRTIVENAVEGIFQTSADGRFLSANPALARICGYESVDDLLSNLVSISHQLYVDFNRRTEFVRLLDQHTAIYNFESAIYRKDGSMTWISENARSVRDEQGNVLYYEGTVEDITERKQTQEALHRAKEELESRVEERTSALRELNQRLITEIAERQSAESTLRALFAAMTDGIAVFDPQGRYLEIVPTNAQIVYEPTAERIGKTVYDVLPTTLAEQFVINIQRALNTRKTVYLEYSMPIRHTQHAPTDSALFNTHASLNGEAWFAASVSPLPDNRVIWVARNITERKRAESALKKAEENYRSIFENAAEGIYQVTAEGRYLSANPALMAMYGCTSLDELNDWRLNVGRQTFLEPEAQSQFIAALERAGVVSHFEAQVCRRDGTVIWVNENARAVRDRNSTLLYYEGTVQDITQRKVAEAALQTEKEKSERLLLNILPATVAHRLKQRQDSDRTVGAVIAESYEQTTILFADIVGFTPLAARMSPSELVDLLNQIFSTFDQLAAQRGLEKIKTIGDAYMAVGGVPLPRADHAEAIADMALEMQETVTRFKRDGNEPFQLRIGINTGPVIAGVIGIRKFIYDLWGDAVNVASRMEAQGMSGQIQVTATTYELLKDHYRLEERGLIEIKGKGEMMTYWLQGKKPS